MQKTWRSYPYRISPKLRAASAFPAHRSWKRHRPPLQRVLTSGAPRRRALRPLVITSAAQFSRRGRVFSSPGPTAQVAFSKLDNVLFKSCMALSAREGGSRRSAVCCALCCAVCCAVCCATACPLPVDCAAGCAACCIACSALSVGCPAG